MCAPLAPAPTIETTRISAVARASSARRPPSGDIPVARRAVAPRQRRRGSGGLLGLLAFTALVAGTVTVLLGFDRTAQVQPSQPLEIEGFRQRPDADGRLLGHFPYPEVPADQRVSFEPGIELHVDAADALDVMMQAGLADGVDLRLLSGYRSQALQESIFFDIASERNQTAEERAQVSAPPGYSEHSTGYAIDLGDGEAPETHLSQSFEQTRAFRWLQNNAARYHFVLSFPRGNQQGVLYEPWHWRYQGTAEALRQFEAARRFTSRRP